MNAVSIIIIGTLGGDWSRWAAGLASPALVESTTLAPEVAVSPAAIELAQPDHPGAASQPLAAVRVRIDATACLSQDSMVKDEPGLRCVAMVERPAIGLGLALTSGQSLDPAEWLASWRSSAQRLLRYSQRNPTTCLLLDAEEARQDLHAMADACAQRFGLPLELPASSAPAPAADPLGHALAEALSRADEDVQSMFAELLASCMLLSAEVPTVAELAPSIRFDGAAAAQRLQQLAARERAALAAAAELPVLTEQLTATVAERDAVAIRAEAAERAVDGLQAQLKQVCAELDASSRDLRSVRDEREQLQLQVHESQEQYLAVYLARCETEEALARATQEAAQAGEKAVAELAALAAAGRKELSTAVAAGEVCARRAGEADGRLETLTGAQDQLRRQLAETETRLAKATHEATQARAKATAELAALAAEGRKQLSAAMGTSETHAQRASEAQSRLEQLTSAHQKLQEQLSATENRLAHATQQAAKAGEKAAAELAALAAAGHNERSAALAAGEAHAQRAGEAQSRLERLTAEHQQLQGRLAAAEDRLVRSAHDAAGAAEQSADLVAALRNDLSAALATADLHAQRTGEVESRFEELSGAHLQIRRQLTDAQARLANQQTEERSLLQEREMALAEVRKIVGELEAERRDADACREEGRLLLMQLHQVQEELVRHHIEQRELQRAAAVVKTRPAMPQVSIGEVTPSLERNTPPHRELTVALRQVKVAGRELADATVRLVEHHGHPGLVVFGAESGESLLQSWWESGREDDRSYALLVPGDEHSQPHFDAMGSIDWLVLQALVVRIEMALTAPNQGLAPHWRLLAARLICALQEMPVRLRYTTVEVRPLGDHATGAWALCFGDAHCGMRQWPRLTIHWHSEGPGATLELRADADDGPPLPSWPVDEAGEPLPGLRLPIGPDPSAQAVRLAWDSLSAANLDFMGGLLVAWPQAVARAVKAQHGMSESTVFTLADAAIAAVALAEAALRPTPAPPAPTPAGLLRRVVNRIRAPSPPAT